MDNSPLSTSEIMLDLIPPRLSARDKRKDRRSTATINKIMLATEDLLLRRGETKITILGICKHAGVSRGTLYRYFSSMEELLDVFTEFMRERFYKKLSDAIAPYDDIDEKFEAFIGYFDDYMTEGASRKFLKVAPEYALTYYARIFDESIQKFQNLLKDVFDVWETRINKTIDRELVCEMMMRYILSEQLTPRKSKAMTMLERIKKILIDP
ncbi:MAG: TetR/AcrR family transcriptional regulator [Emcibacter sp.]|nr:TetR/AcrR family transcriptional regulator [Emcibacter sp.]